MKTSAFLILLFGLSALAQAAPQTLNCKLNYVTHTQGSDPQEYTYTASTQMALVDAGNHAAFLSSSTDVAFFAAKYDQGLLEMQIKESDTGHEAFSVGPLSKGQASKVFLVTDRRYTLSEDMTKIELSCAVKDL